jgi:Protein of unknown function (DUF2471)
MDSNGENLNKKQFARAVRDLERITRQIAARYIAQGVPLTWRLLHAIEGEAVADLGFAGRHEAALRALFARPDDFRYPETDDVVDFSSSDGIRFRRRCVRARCATRKAEAGTGGRALIFRPRAPIDPARIEPRGAL